MSFTLPGGQILSLPVKVSEVVISTPKPNGVKNYARLVLELGTQFLLLLKMCKTPIREKMLPLLKMILVTLKANNTHSKYALELLRFLVLQYSLLPEKDARQMFLQCFVNTTGRSDSYVPCDLVMEWQVRDQKRHIKHMFSNKTDENILARSTALGGIEKITDNYDKDAGVRQRSKGHRSVSAVGDEMEMIAGLRDLRPFKISPGRKGHEYFKSIKPTLTEYFDGADFHQWFFKHKDLFKP